MDNPFSFFVLLIRELVLLLDRTTFAMYGYQVSVFGIILALWLIGWVLKIVLGGKKE